MSRLSPTELYSMGLPKELWEQISVDNPTTYYKLLQVSKIFKLDTNIMKAKFIRKSEVNSDIYHSLPNGWLHSCDDQPAKIYSNGDQFWYVDDKLHRDNDQPATIYAEGTQYWYINGKKHRNNNQPAVVYASGARCWYMHGVEYYPLDFES